MLVGTLDMLVLRTLLFGAAHGHAIAHAIESTSEEVLQVEHGSFYPALHRLEDQGLIVSFWGTSENNRKAKYYRLSPPAGNIWRRAQSLGVACARVSARHGSGNGVTHEVVSILAASAPRCGSSP